MMDRECFLENFSLGISTLLAVPKEHCGAAVKVIEKYHRCYVIGRVERDEEHADARVWMEEKLKL